VKNNIKLIGPFAAIASVFFIFYSFFYWRQGEGGLAVLYAITAIYSTFNFVYYLKSGKENVVRLALSLVGIPIFLPVQINGGAFGAGIFLYYVYVVWIFFLLGKKKGIIFVFFLFLMSLSILGLQNLGVLAKYYEDGVIYFFYFNLLLQTGLVYFYQESKEQLESKLMADTQMLTAKTQQLEVEVEKRLKFEEELKTYTKDLESVKKATLNILDDLNDERNNFKSLSDKFKLATESADIGIWEWDVVKNVITWDEKMYKLYGIKEGDFGGAYEAWQSGLHPDDKKKGDEEIQKALRGEKEFDTSFRVVWPNKTIRYIRAHAIVLRDKDGNPLKMVGVNWDITKEKEIEKAKSDFLSVASHELRTPMTAIKGFVSMIKDGDYGQLPEGVNEPLQDISTSVDRLISLVNDLLNVSRIEAGRVKYTITEFSLGGFVNDIVASLQPLAKNAGLQLTSNIEDVVVSADKNKVTQILNNLIGNSLKFTEKGSISLSTQKSGDQVLILVTDTGIGIGPDDQRKLFGKFNQVEDAQRGHIQGTGLGLYISKSIAQKMGGDVWIKDSVVGQGTTFAFSVPMAKTELAQKVIGQIEADAKNNPDQKELS